MRSSLIPVLCVSVVFAFAAGGRAADDDIKAVIAKAIKAHGGEELLAKMKAGTTKNKGTIDVPGLGETEFTSESSFMLPDKFKESMQLQAGGKQISVVTVMNGDKASITADGNDVPITDAIKQALKDQQYMLKAARLVSLVKDKEYELAPLGESKVEGKTCVGVRISSKGHKDFSLFFNKETDLLAKVEFRTVDLSTGKELTEERIVLEYTKKDKDQPPLPKKLRIDRDGKKFIEVETEAKMVEKLDDSDFQK